MNIKLKLLAFFIFATTIAKSQPLKKDAQIICCDTMGHILSSAKSNYVPRKKELITIGGNVYKVLSVVKYSDDEYDIYVAEFKPKNKK